MNSLSALLPNPPTPICIVITTPEEQACIVEQRREERAIAAECESETGMNQYPVGREVKPGSYLQAAYAHTYQIVRVISRQDMRSGLRACR